jgi:thiamine-monophosphate kinase
MTPTVGEVGEQGVLQLVQQFCPAAVVGDDAAVLSVPADRDLVVTTDLLVDEVHFSDRTTPAHAVGWRAVTANLSDLAAMGAVPTAITVGLGLPPDTALGWLESLYQGMSDCLHQFGGAIVGGDVVRSPVRTLAITALGWSQPGWTITRSSAQVGDVILVTGYHGSSRAGLKLLLQPESGQHLSAADRQDLIRAHRYPKPRLDVLPLLAAGPPPAGMDSSDGLADAVLQICRASGVGARLERSRLPLHPALAHYDPVQAMDWLLYGGEEFELVLVLPAALAARLVQVLPAGAAVIGEITADRDVRLLDATGQWPEQILSRDRGFQHFG